MYDEKWGAVFCIGFVLIVFGTISGIEYMRHVEKMECIKSRGDWADKACRFTK